MRIEYRIVGISLGFGVLSWIADAAIDARYFSDTGFVSLLISDVPAHDLYMRTVILGSYLLFGIVAAHLIKQRQERETRVEEKSQKLDEMTGKLQNQYRTLFEEAPVMAVVTREEEEGPVIEDCNEQFLDTLSYEREAVVGRELESFYTAESRDRLLIEGGYERALEGDFTREHRDFRTADGERVETLVRAVPRRNRDGEIIGTLAMYVDITEREQVKRANDRLEEFTRIVSHDLRNPLNVAEGRLELARGECDTEHLDSVAQSLDRMNVLIDDLLTLAKRGKQLGDVETVDFRELASICWENVDTQAATVQIDIDRTITADRSRLQQLLENLIRNAIEHGGKDVTVTIGELPDGFYIEDDGPGIPEADRAEIFEVGYSTSETGTGFGLSIVEKIATAHGWDVTVQEGEEGGARFEFSGVEFGDA